MDETDTFTGYIRPLRSISPTVFTALKACALRETWSVSGNRPLLPLSPKARVGTISHRLLAEGGKGILQNQKSAVEARWRELVAEVENEMRSSWVERHLVPLAQSVPDLEVHRIRAVTRALNILQVRSEDLQPNRLHGEGTGYGYELPVRSSDGLVRGVIDAALPTREGPSIRDYKSGAIFETSGVDRTELKEIYQIQLKMYAALYADCFGKWPVRLEVVPLSGEAFEVQFSREECTDLIGEARQLFQEINESISTYDGGSLRRILANPSARNCYQCLYRPACKAYWSEMKDDGEWPLDVRGIVKDVKTLGNTKVQLQVLTEKNLANIARLASGDRHPLLHSVTVGDIVTVLNLRRSKSNESYTETSMTTIHKFDYEKHLKDSDSMTGGESK